MIEDDEINVDTKSMTKCKRSFIRSYCGKNERLLCQIIGCCTKNEHRVQIGEIIWLELTMTF